MAAIDQFEFLFREISRTFTSFKDALAIIGAIYATRKTLKFTCKSLSSVCLIIQKNILPATDLKKQFGGSWAVVTGSSEGIGRAYACELASRGLNIVLISRAENRLFRAAQDIENRFGVKTCTIPIDFSEGLEIYTKIRQCIENKDIGILVNNVGVMYEYPQYFLNVPEERIWQIIMVNVMAATKMTHMILPQMVERGKGAVVIMSSGACTQITPQMTVYAATKSYLDYFARALHYEYKKKGIFVQSLQPFYVATRMTRYSKTLSSTNLFIPNAAVYAKHAVTTLGYHSRTSGYWPHAIQAWFAGMISEKLWMWSASRLNNGLRRQAMERQAAKKATRLSSDGSFDAPDNDSEATTPIDPK